MKFRMNLRLFFVVLCLTASLASSQGLDYIKANYTKFEYMVAMRDGVKLFTQVYAPKDRAQRYPILMQRTPYSVAPYGEDSYRDPMGPSEWFGKEQYIFVYQDVRGRNHSEGEYLNMTPHKEGKGPKDFDESSDTYDTIDWLVKNIPGNNGKVGMWGISYPGFYVAAGMIDAHPALKAVSPQAPISDWFVGDDFHHNGALYLAHMFRFFNVFGRSRMSGGGTPATVESNDGYRFFLDLGPLSNINKEYFHDDIGFWNDIVAHPDYDAWWKARDLRPHLKNIKPAVMTVGGWFDAEDLFGAINVSKSVEQQGHDAPNILVMGPWFHGGWSRGDGELLGNVHFNSKTSAYYRENIELPFFNYWLKGKGTGNGPKAYVFETGSNTWRELDAWPPKNAKEQTLYLQPGGKLGWTAPPSGGSPFDEYVSDPAKPVPYISAISLSMTREHMTDDQRFAASRPDVLVYQTEPLTEDLTLAGPITNELFVSTSGTDSDFVVKVIDVYPDSFPDPSPNPAGVRMGGYEQLIRGELFRGRYRNGYDHPEAFKPGEVARIRYTMPDIFHTFRAGHRLMIQVQSSWFPVADRNPQKFVDIYHAKAEDFQKATERVYRGGQQASDVKVMVVK
jgi:uncharacterized protein